MTHSLLWMFNGKRKVKKTYCPSLDGHIPSRAKQEEKLPHRFPLGRRYRLGERLVKLVGDLIVRGVSDGVIRPAFLLVHQDALGLPLRIGVSEGRFGREPVAATRNRTSGLPTRGARARHRAHETFLQREQKGVDEECPDIDDVSGRYRGVLTIHPWRLSIREAELDQTWWRTCVRQRCLGLQRGRWAQHWSGC